MTRTSHDQPPTYEGRPLPQPDEAVFDQGLQFDLSTVFTRRRLLSMAGLGAGALAIAACSGSDSNSSTSSTGSATGTQGTTGTTGTTVSEGTSAATTAATAEGDTLLEIPDETNGPYPADGSNGPDILEQSGVVRRDITTSFGGSTGVADGVPLTFTFTVLDMANANAPFAGAAVYAWHCDAEGGYSMYSAGLENENYLRGVQVADADGNVTFTSIFPGCYAGRWPHIHFEVYPDVDSITDHDLSISTSQAAFPEDASNDVFDNVALYSASIRNFANLTIDDGIFTSDTIDQQMLTLTGDRQSGFTGSLVVPVDTTTEQTVTGMGGGDPGGPGPGGGGPGGPGGQPPDGTPPSGG